MAGSTQQPTLEALVDLNMLLGLGKPLKAGVPSHSIEPGVIGITSTELEWLGHVKLQTACLIGRLLSDTRFCKV